MVCFWTKLQKVVQKEKEMQTKIIKFNPRTIVLAKVSLPTSKGVIRWDSNKWLNLHWAIVMLILDYWPILSKKIAAKNPIQYLHYDVECLHTYP